MPREDEKISRDRNMVTAVKRWIMYEVGNGSSVGAVVFRWVNDDYEDLMMIIMWIYDDYEDNDDQEQGCNGSSVGAVVFRWVGRHHDARSCLN